MYDTLYKLPAADGASARPEKRGCGRPKRKPPTQPTESRPVVLGLSEALLAEVEVSCGKRSPFKKQNAANGTPSRLTLPAVNGTDSLKRRRGRPSKVTVVPLSATDATQVAAAKYELDAGGGRPGKFPVKCRDRPASGEPKPKKKKNVPQVVAAAPESTLVNLEYKALQKKMEIIQSTIKKAVGVVKPYLSTAENPGSAMAAILELEEAAAAAASMDSRLPPLVDLNLPPDCAELNG